MGVLVFNSRSLLLSLSLLTVLGASCDKPPSSGSTTTSAGATTASASAQGTPAGVPKSETPPDAFHQLELGAQFLQTNWGPDITAEQLTTFKTAAEDAVTAEKTAHTDVETAQLKLTQALLSKAGNEELIARSNDIVTAERAFVDAQVSGVLSLLGCFDAEQMKTRLKMGTPPILSELVSGHPMTGAANPFARLDTDSYSEKDKEEVLKRKLEVHGQYLVYQKAMAEAVGKVSKLDLTQPDWTVKYKEVMSGTLTAWETYRRFAVASFAAFVSQMPADKRIKLLMDDGVAQVLKPAESRGAGTGNLIPSNPNEANVDLATTSSGTPGGDMGGQGGLGGQGGR
jgi:hypothetical protein